MMSLMQNQKEIMGYNSNGMMQVQTAEALLLDKMMQAGYTNE